MTNRPLVSEVAIPSALELQGGDGQLQLTLSRSLTEWERAVLAEGYEAITMLMDHVLIYETPRVNPRRESFEEVVQFLNDDLEAAAAKLQADWEGEHAKVLEQLRPVAMRQGFVIAD